MNNILTTDPSHLLQLIMSQKEGNHQTPVQNFISKLASTSENIPLGKRCFGLKEAGVQTDLTGAQIDEFLDRKQETLQQELVLLQKRNSYESEHFNNNLYQFKENSYLGNKRKNDSDNAETETSPYSSLSQKNQSISRLDIIHTTPFTETNASDLSSNLKRKKDNAQMKKNIKGLRKKVDAYHLFKEEFKQVHHYTDEDELEQKCKGEWNALSKDLKRFYNMNAELENKAIKKLQKNKKKELTEEEKDKNETLVNTS